MFRYDRPQAGRYRQFWQFDVEVIGDPGPAVDAEIIELAPRSTIGRAARRDGSSWNSIGDAACRRPTSRSSRPTTGPRRPSCRRSSATAGAEPAPDPRLEGHGDGRAERGRAEDHRPAVRRVRRPLRRSERTSTRWASYTLEPVLVRGLDYYTRTAFEFYPAARTGSSPRSAAAGGTTGSLSCSAGGPRRGSASGSGWTGAAGAARAGLGVAPLAARAGRGRGRRRSGRYSHAAADRDRAASGWPCGSASIRQREAREAARGRKATARTSR